MGHNAHFEVWVGNRQTHWIFSFTSNTLLQNVLGFRMFAFILSMSNSEDSPMWYNFRNVFLLVLPCNIFRPLTFILPLGNMFCFDKYITQKGVPCLSFFFQPHIYKYMQLCLNVFHWPHFQETYHLYFTTALFSQNMFGIKFICLTTTDKVFIF